MARPARQHSRRRGRRASIGAKHVDVTSCCRRRNQRPCTTGASAQMQQFPCYFGVLEFDARSSASPREPHIGARDLIAYLLMSYTFWKDQMISLEAWRPVAACRLRAV